jgi:hypothetical protein
VTISVDVMIRGKDKKLYQWTLSAKEYRPEVDKRERESE